MGTSSVLRELEDLRSLLDSPNKTYKPFSALNLTNTATTTPKVTKIAYSQALSTAERSVDRLGKAIEMAEEEMEAALRRTTEVHKSQLRQKEVELAESQRVLVAKERSIDSLRDTLATTKRTYEARLSHLESALSLKEAEVISLREEVRTARLESESLASQLQQQVSEAQREVGALRNREAEMAVSTRARSEEVAKALAALRAERLESNRAAQGAADLRRQVELLNDELRVLRVEGRAEKERLELEVAELGKRLRAERSVRKACEKWLRSELRSREEMEVLLSCIKDAAGGKLSGTAADMDDVEALLAGLQAQVSPEARRALPASPGLLQSSDPTVVALEGHNRRVHQDNTLLKAELAAARKLLRERLLS